jgi:hypothetical protein
VSGRAGLSHSSREYCEIRIRNITHQLTVNRQVHLSTFFAFGREHCRTKEAAHRVKLDENNLERWKIKLEVAA